jgi:hypothetical protein
VESKISNNNKDREEYADYPSESGAAAKSALRGSADASCCESPWSFLLKIVHIGAIA